MERTPLQWMIEPLRKYARFRGRACRAEYWWFAVLNLAVEIAGDAIEAALHAGEPLGLTVSDIASIALLLPGFAVTVRRLHDLDRSGWWLGGGLAVLVAATVALVVAVDNGADESVLTSLAYVGVLFLTVAVLLIAMARPGTQGPNRYGPDPLAPEHADLARDFA